MIYTGSFDGHSGIEQNVRETDTVGDFKTALSYVKEQDTGHFVIHAYSSKRSMTGIEMAQNDFLTEIGFTEFDSCNALDRSQCYYYVLESVDRDPVPDIGSGRAHPKQKYETFVGGLQEAFEKYRDADKWLQEVGLDAAHR